MRNVIRSSKLFVLGLFLALFAIPAGAQSPAITVDIPADDDLARFNSVLWSPDGAQFLASYGDGIGVWDATTGQPRLQVDVTGRGWWAADSTAVLTHDMTNNTLTRWDISSGDTVYTVPNRDPLDTVSPDGVLLLTTDAGTVQVRDAATGDVRHTLDALPFDWTWLDDTTVAATDGDQVQRWDVRAGEQLNAFSIVGRVEDITAERLFTVQRTPDETRMTLYNLTDGTQVREYRLSADVAQVRIGPTGETLYVVSRPADGDRVIVWDINAGDGLRLPVSEDAPRRVLVARPAPDNAHLLTVSYALDADTGRMTTDSGRFTLWDTVTGEIVAQQSLDGIVDGLWGADGEQVLVWGESGGELIRVPDGETVFTVDGPASGATFSADSRLAVWGSGQIRVWELAEAG